MNYDKNWYNSLNKPFFQPPAWVFAPVWTILYVLIAASFAFILLTPFRKFEGLAYLLFFIQLILNFAWTPVFFGIHKIKQAFFICLALTIVTILMTIVFYQISQLAGLILIPYVLWLIFASILNLAIWQLNKPD